MMHKSRTTKHNATLSVLMQHRAFINHPRKSYQPGNKMSASLSAATLLPAVFLVQLVIVVNGQYQFYGAQTQYLLVQVPGELDKICST